jgi:plastocyanin
LLDATLPSSLEKLMKKLITLATLAGLLGLVAYCQPHTQATGAEPTPQPKSPAVKLVQADADLATLRAKFVFDGKPPVPPKIDSSRDAFCAAIDIKEDKLIVGKDGAIKDIAIYMDAKRSKVEVPEKFKKAEKAVIKLDNKGCMFEPHVLFARPGQSIDVLNSDQTGHNANFNFFNNTPVNFLIPVGGSKKIELQTDEPAPIPVECNVHPWMKSYLIVQDHPYVGITGEDGVLEITNLPPGEVTFRVWHEIGKIDEVTIDGKKEKWSRGRMEIELKPGMNDLGEIKLSPELFE